MIPLSTNARNCRRDLATLEGESCDRSLTIAPGFPPSLRQKSDDWRIDRQVWRRDRTAKPVDEMIVGTHEPASPVGNGNTGVVRLGYRANERPIMCIGMLH